LGDCVREVSLCLIV